MPKCYKTIPEHPWKVTWEHWNAGIWRNLTEDEVLRLENIGHAVSANVVYGDLGEQIAYAATDESKPNGDYDLAGPWQVLEKRQPKLLTRVEHRNAVIQAIAEGKVIPPEVLDEYPDLLG